MNFKISDRFPAQFPEGLLTIWQNKAVRFLICGAMTAAFNVVVLAAIIQIFGIQTPWLRNVANICSIEISVLFSFFAYRAWVWSADESTLPEMLLRQMPLYHLSVSISTLGRILILFPLCDWLGMHYVINTVVGILLGSVVNYKISDRWVFGAKRKQANP